jgi:hypothetical protein
VDRRRPVGEDLAVPVPTGQVDHRDVEHALLAAGWTPCGAGDWAIALRSPDGTAAARISPFDPTGPYTAELYRLAGHTRQVPELFAHRRLVGGGDLQVMEWLQPVAEDEAVAFHRAIALRSPEVAERWFMTEIPLSASGPWEPEAQEAMRVGLAAADVRRRRVVAPHQG